MFLFSCWRADSSCFDRVRASDTWRLPARRGHAPTLSEKKIERQRQKGTSRSTYVNPSHRRRLIIARSSCARVSFVGLRDVHARIVRVYVRRTALTHARFVSRDTYARENRTLHAPRTLIVAGCYSSSALSRSAGRSFICRCCPSREGAAPRTGGQAEVCRRSYSCTLRAERKEGRKQTSRKEGRKEEKREGGREGGRETDCDVSRALPAGAISVPRTVHPAWASRTAEEVQS